MKYVVGILVIVVGLSLIGLCVAVRQQFNAVAAQGNPDLDEYPLVKLFVPGPAPSSNAPGAASAAQLAQKLLFRINMVGVTGLVLVVVGILILVLGGRNPADHTDGDQ
jgi:hypothetical protein